MASCEGSARERETSCSQGASAARNVPVQRCKCYKDIKIEDTEPKLGLLIYKLNHIKFYTTNNVQPTSKEKHACTCMIVLIRYTKNSSTRTKTPI